MAYMKTIPDKYFELACVDPPYGDGNGGNANRFGGMFGAIYGENTRSHSVKVERDERTAYNRFGGRFANTSVTRTGGTWAKKYEKKS